MKEFLMAALPWICMCIILALIDVIHSQSQKSKANGEDYDNYMGIGMCIKKQNT